MTEIDAIRDAIVDGAPGRRARRACRSRRRTGARSCGPTSRRCSPGVPSEEKDPRKSLHIDEVPLPELAPDEALVAVMASSINFNTVWTSIFEPLPTFGFLAAARTRERVGRAARPAVPRRRQRRRRRGAARRLGGADRGSRATRSPCTATTSTTRTRRAHDDSMLATNQRIWGYETNYGGLGELTRGEGQPADAEARAPHVGGGGGQRADQLHELPHAREPERRADDPGPDRADLGRERRHRRVRVPVRAERRRHAGRRGVEPGARRAAARDGRRARDRPQGRGLPVLERRAHAGPGRVAPARQEDPRARGHRPRHRVRAPRSFDDGRVGVRVHARRHDHHVRGHQRLHDRVRQPLPLDEPEDAQGLPLRELPRGVGGEPARSAKVRIHPVLSAVFPFDEVARGGRPGAPQPARGQARRAGARARGRPRRHRPRAARAARSTQITLFRTGDDGASVW